MSPPNTPSLYCLPAAFLLTVRRETELRVPLLLHKLAVGARPLEVDSELPLAVAAVAGVVAAGSGSPAIPMPMPMPPRGPASSLLHRPLLRVQVYRSSAASVFHVL